MSKRNILLSFSLIALTAFILIFPEQALDAAGESTQLWFNRAMPSLLPFMISMNILSAIGFTEFTGKWLTKFMKIFGIPGEGGFALIAGMSSGYPMGAKVTANLRENGILSQTEAQRLISFANNSGPLFILGTVGVSMFNSKQIGYFLILTHYAAALITGLLFYLFTFREKDIHTHAEYIHPDIEKNKPLGKILKKSVIDSMDSMTLIGGFIIFFGVICRCFLMIPFFTRQFAYVSVGILELTNGLYLSQNAGLPLKIRIFTAAVLISFGGISVHAQTISMISKTDIKVSLYLLSKIIHAILALGVSYVLYPAFSFN